MTDLTLPSDSSERDSDLIPLSALQHAVYCLRQAALIHIERLWAENRFTAEGQILHLAADREGERRVRGIRRVTALSLSSSNLGIAGIADLVEFRKTPDGEIPFPVEYKRGKPKTHHADEVQLCAQALCLEEMTARAVPEGALFYAEIRRRIVVSFDDTLRQETLDVIRKMRALFGSLVTPKAVFQAGHCRACSLLDLCRPKALAKSAMHWRDRMLSDALESDPS